jgi:hypothetical protein
VPLLLAAAEGNANAIENLRLPSKERVRAGFRCEKILFRFR